MSESGGKYRPPRKATCFANCVSRTGSRSPMVMIPSSVSITEPPTHITAASTWTDLSQE